MNGEIVAAMTGWEAITTVTVVFIAAALVRLVFRKALEAWQ